MPRRPIVPVPPVTVHPPCRPRGGLFSLFDDKNKVSIANVGGIEVVLKALRNHRKDLENPKKNNEHQGKRKKLFLKQNYLNAV